MRLAIPFNGPAYKSESLFLSPQECTNFYLRPYPEAGSKKFALFGTPGLELFCTPSVGKEVRALFQWGSYLYAVVGNGFYRVLTGGTFSLKGTLNTNTGRVSIATNGLDITMVDGSYGYVYDLTTETLTQITDTDFPHCRIIVQIDGYYLVGKSGSGQVWRSDYNNGLSWNGLAFSTAGSDPDNIVSLLVDHRDVWILGEYTAELWYNTGAATFNFARISGAVVEQGVESAYARTKINNAVYWLGRDRTGDVQVFQATGRQPKVVSTIPITLRMSECDTSDAFMFSYQQLGHSHVVLTFPSSDVTLVYDSTTGQWHERSSRISGSDKRWRPNCHAVFNGDHIVGDYTNGKLYKLKTDVYDEDGDDLIAVRTSAIVRDRQNRITVNEVQIVTEPGVGISTGDSEDVDPQGLFSWSKDGGRNWSSEVDIPLGKIGETKNRAKVFQLGQGRNWTFRLKVSAAVKRVVLGAVMEVEEDYG